jgi:hypothetical protein
MEFRFVVDEASFEFDPSDPAKIETSLKLFLDLLDYARASSQLVLRWSQIFFIESVEGKPLHEILGTEGPLNRDLRILASGRIEKLPCWDDLNLIPPCEIQVEGVNLDIAPSIGLCLLMQQEPHYLGCLTTESAGRRGELNVIDTVGRLEGKVHFLHAPNDAPEFWRSIIEPENLDESKLEGLQALAFPVLRFGDRSWNRIKDFEGNFRELRPQLVRDLIGLNDLGIQLWQECATPDEFTRRMSATAHVECSPESPQTRHDAVAMRQREIQFDGETIICDWHTKLEGHRNRVYFSIQSDGIIVGIFHKHLN